MLIGSSRGCGCAKSSFHVWLTKLGGTRVLFGPSDFINAQSWNDGYSRVVDLPGHALAQGQDVDEKFFQAQHPTTSKSDRHFHNHGATNRRDKIFALLGKSSEASLPIKVDYNKSWKTLFHELIRIVVGDEAKILTWDDEEAALIHCFSCILGRVSNVSKATAFHHHDLVRVESDHFRGPYGTRVDWSASWTIPTTVKPILKGEIVCLLEGASEPTMIRPRATANIIETQFSVIALSIGSPNTVWFPAPFPKLLPWAQFLDLVTSFNRTLVLSWHWGFDRALQGPR
jgi:hypothetical protein